MSLSFVAGGEVDPGLLTGCIQVAHLLTCLPSHLPTNFHHISGPTSPETSNHASGEARASSSGHPVSHTSDPLSPSPPAADMQTNQTSWSTIRLTSRPSIHRRRRGQKDPPRRRPAPLVVRFYKRNTIACALRSIAIELRLADPGSYAPLRG